MQGQENNKLPHISEKTIACLIFYNLKKTGTNIHSFGILYTESPSF